MQPPAASRVIRTSLTAPPPLNRTPDIYVFAKDYVQPLTHQWSANGDYQLGRNYGLTVGYLGVKGEHLTRTRDINLFPPQPVQGTIDGQAVSFLRYPGTGGPARPDKAFGRISLFDSGGNSIYHGGFIQITKRFAQGITVQTSYTFSKVIDDKPDQTQVVVGVDDAKQVQYPTLPALDRGHGNTDTNHRFVIAGVWDIAQGYRFGSGFARQTLGGWQLSLISQVQSGRWFSAGVNNDPNNDGNFSTDRPPGVGRDTFFGPNFMTADVRISKEIRVWERARLRLMGEAFNVTNRANYNALLTNQYNYNAATRAFTTAAGFLTPTTTFDPRILQLAAKFTF